MFHLALSSGTVLRNNDHTPGGSNFKSVLCSYNKKWCCIDISNVRHVCVWVTSLAVRGFEEFDGFVK